MLCCTIGLCFGKSSKEYGVIELSPSYDVGFFCVFTTVIGALDYYERQKLAGLLVNFAKRGAYYDARLGDNWWQYYFEPIAFGSSKNSKFHTFSESQKAQFSNDTKYVMNRTRAHHLIKKYIHIKPHITNRVRAFYRGNFKDSTVIGIHYRGTDKMHEAPTVSYECVQKALKKVAKKYREKAIKVFVATDEEPFLRYMQKKSPYPVIFYDAIRSQGVLPVHLICSGDAYKKGEDALTDCLLLSKCDFLIKMASNLSDTALLFNSHLKWMALNTSYEQARQDARRKK